MSDPSDDARLVARAQRGEAAALNQLLERHYDRIHAVCRRITGTASDADDAAQEALIRIVRGLSSFDGRSQFGTWAYRVATNVSLDELRRRRRRPQLHSVRGGMDGEPEPADPRAEREMIAPVDRIVLDTALAELPDEFRAPLVLRDVSDLDYAEIAEVLQIPIGTVKSRLARGRRQLAARLLADDGDARHTARGNQAPSGERPIDEPPVPT